MLFAFVFVTLLVGLIVGSSFTVDMYIYNDSGYHYCIDQISKYVNPTFSSADVIVDPVTGTAEQDFFFVPVDCISSFKAQT